MSEKDINSVAIAAYDPTHSTKAIDIRRQMLQLPEISQSLQADEKYIFEASTKTQVSEMPEAVFVDKMKQLLRYIAIDVGYNIPANDEWGYIQVRIMDIIRRYYSHLTLADIKLAFELSTLGKLDDYLPRDANGVPDRKHYQHFNAEYFGKILNAYIRRRGQTIQKAYDLLPKPEKPVNPAKKRYYQRKVMRDFKQCFLKYKYSGKLEFRTGDEIIIYDRLLELGFADNISESEKDRQEALRLYLLRVAAGLVNSYTADYVKAHGTKSHELDATAYEVARRKEIARAFDIMIAEEVQIDEILTMLNNEN